MSFARLGCVQPWRRMVYRILVLLLVLLVSVNAAQPKFTITQCEGSAVKTWCLRGLGSTGIIYAEMPDSTQYAVEVVDGVNCVFDAKGCSLALPLLDGSVQALHWGGHGWLPTGVIAHGDYGAVNEVRLSEAADEDLPLQGRTVSLVHENGLVRLVHPSGTPTQVVTFQPLDLDGRGSAVSSMDGNGLWTVQTSKEDSGLPRTHVRYYEWSPNTLWRSLFERRVDMECYKDSLSPLARGRASILCRTETEPRVQLLSSSALSIEHSFALPSHFAAAPLTMSAAGDGNGETSVVCEGKSSDCVVLRFGNGGDDDTEALRRNWVGGRVVFIPRHEETGASLFWDPASLSDGAMFIDIILGLSFTVLVAIGAGILIIIFCIVCCPCLSGCVLLKCLLDVIVCCCPCETVIGAGVLGWYIKKKKGSSGNKVADSGELKPDGKNGLARRGSFMEAVSGSTVRLQPSGKTTIEIVDL